MKNIQNEPAKRKQRFFSHGKKPPKGYNPKATPSEKSLWAYWMQAIEPNNSAIDAAFPGYHPLWVQRSQRLTVSGEQFKFFRQYLLGISQKQCAAYLRVTLRIIQAWEQNRVPVPFMAFELLRLVYEGSTFKLSHPDWDGWFIEPKSGKLVSPDRGDLSFSPAELSYVRETYSSKTNLEADNDRLRAEVAALKTELEELRSLINNDGLLDELHLMKDHIAAMLEKVGSTTAKVYQFPSFDQPKVITA